jgi:hypothetical protein
MRYLSHRRDEANKLLLGKKKTSPPPKKEMSRETIDTSKETLRYEGVAVFHKIAVTDKLNRACEVFSVNSPFAIGI